jgi:hypothetical protein
MRIISIGYVKRKQASISRFSSKSGLLLASTFDGEGQANGLRKFNIVHCRCQHDRSSQRRTLGEAVVTKLAGGSYQGGLHIRDSSGEGQEISYSKSRDVHVAKHFIT